MYSAGLSISEIARLTGLERSTVASRLRRWAERHPDAAPCLDSKGKKVVPVHLAKEIFGLTLAGPSEINPQDFASLACEVFALQHKVTMLHEILLSLSREIDGPQNRAAMRRLRQAAKRRQEQAVEDLIIKT